IFKRQKWSRRLLRPVYTAAVLVSHDIECRRLACSRKEDSLMLDVRPTSIRARLTCLVLSVCLTVALITILCKVQAAPSPFPKSPAEQSPKTIPTNGTVNGKVVFSSDRNIHGKGFRLWTMKGDGSNVAQ